MIRKLTNLFLILTLIFVFGCATKGLLKIEDQDKVLKIEEYDKKMQVTEIPGQVQVAPAPTVSEGEVSTPAPITPIKKAKPKAKTIQEIEREAKRPEVKIKKQPELEDSENFIGRRPLVDPFKVGEKTVLKLSYFNVVAGDISLEVKPFVQVNDRKSYHFFMTAKSNAFFSSVYRVEDSAETFLDFDRLIPYNMAVHIKESKQLREVRALFDWTKLEAKYWDKKVTDKGIEEKNKIWSIPEYSQNIISAIYYLRTFTLRPGKSVKFRLADEHKNMVVTANVIRREKLETEIGVLDTLVIQPEIAIEGVFKPMGEVFFWLTDDERKFLVKLESKIKIGKIVAKLKELKRE